MKNKKILLIFVPILIASLYIAGDSYRDHRRATAKINAYADIPPLIDIAETDKFETKMDKIRLFLFKNTEYSEGEEFHKIWGNHPAIAQRIIASANGTNEKRAPLECSARSGAMENILIGLGYNVRSIAVSAYRENYDSHAFLEVQNPETGKWHTQDIQFNVYWRMKDDGRRASIYDLVQYSHHDYEPCRTPDNCGWDLPNREGSFAKDLTGHFGIASINDYQRGRRPLINNTSKFDMDTAQKVNGEMLTYCEFIDKNCREEITKY